MRPTSLATTSGWVRRSFLRSRSALGSASTRKLAEFMFQGAPRNGFALPKVGPRPSNFPVQPRCRRIASLFQKRSILLGRNQDHRLINRDGTRHRTSLGHPRITSHLVAQSSDSIRVSRRRSSEWKRDANQIPLAGWAGQTGSPSSREYRSSVGAARKAKLPPSSAALASSSAGKSS